MALVTTRRTVCAGILCAPFVRMASAVAETPAHAGAIDMHCHLFNADDLPVRGFVEHAFLHAEEGGLFAPPKALLALVIDVIGNAAPSATREFERLRGGLGLTVEDPTERDAIFEDRLAASIERLAAIAAGQEAALTAPDADKPTPDEARELLDDLSLLGASAPGAFALARPPGPDSPGLLARSLNARIDAAERAAPAPGTAALRLPGGAVLRGLSWARLMLDWRGDILARYERLYGGFDGVGMITPALVDFDNWVRSRPGPASSLEQQVKVMSELSRRGSRQAMHGHVPFDPVRVVVEARPEPLALIEWAVEEMGFVGVKLYPPMGFYPYDNLGKGADFAEEIRASRSSEALAAEIDHALGRLYEWASAPERRVPLLAHARQSWGSRKEYEERARPASWAGAFTAHPQLKVALAHFGDFTARSRDDPVWEDDLPALMDGHAGAYADLSYLVGAMDDDVERNRHKAERLRTFATPERTRHLLFGTDWSMTGLASGHDGYLSGLDAQLARAGFDHAARRRVFRDNAVEFLGLADGMPGRARLERFYGRNSMDPEMLQRVIS